MPPLAAAGPALRLAGQHAATVADVYDKRDSGSTGWAIVGYSLALILLYVLIADARVVGATGKAIGGAAGAADAWIKPVDPVAAIGGKLGYTPTAPASSATGTASAGGAQAGVRSNITPQSGYVGPFAGSATVGRTDQGVDFSATPGESVLAIGKAKIAGIIPNWYQGQPMIYYKLLNGPRAGQYVYAAEQITPSVKPGQIVNAGQPIGKVATSGTGLELGFATSTGATLARSTTGYVEGGVTKAGEQFKAFLGL